jgi:hypothetical protein
LIATVTFVIAPVRPDTAIVDGYGDAIVGGGNPSLIVMFEVFEKLVAAASPAQPRAATAASDNTKNRLIDQDRPPARICLRRPPIG